MSEGEKELYLLAQHRLQEAANYALKIRTVAHHGFHDNPIGARSTVEVFREMLVAYLTDASAALGYDLVERKPPEAVDMGR